MLWQDYIITAANILGGISLLQMALDTRTRTARSIAVQRIIVLLSIAFAEWTLGLVAGPLVLVLLCCLWVWIFLKRHPGVELASGAVARET